MKYEELIILLPCHSLEDFPVHHKGEDAEGLLSAWCALWHPELLASAGSTPAWYRVDSPPENLTNRLIVVPSVSQSQLPTGFPQRAQSAGAVLIHNQPRRAEIIKLALEQLGAAQPVEEPLVADFLALGYCYLQVELLTRQMRYASNLDEVHFRNQVVAAAVAATDHRPREAYEKLAACFDLLGEERDHYYPVDAFVLDLTLVAATTIGQPLRNELASTTPINLLMEAEVLASVQDTDPETLAALRQSIQSGAAALVGGEAVERRLPLLPVEAILGELRRGIDKYQDCLGSRPRVYGRRRFGLTPALPQILKKLGFVGVLHATLDDGRFPEGSHIKTRWEGGDGQVIDALARAPLDATKAETYLGFAVKMGETMDMDHVASVCLAHWPGQACPWYDDLRRIAKYTSALGKFVTVDQYFRETDLPGRVDRFTADQYHSPYLKQAIAARQVDPISTSVRYWRRRAIAEAVQALTSLVCLIRNDASAELPQLTAEVDCHAEQSDLQALDVRLADALALATRQLSECLPRTSETPDSGYLIANPCSFVRRVGIELPDLPGLPNARRPIYAAAQYDGRNQVVVDVPPMGFAWVAAGDAATIQKRPPGALASECLLHNEFFEVVINPTTGALQAIHEYTSRGNRMSQQLAYRFPGDRSRGGETGQDPDDAALYSVMTADSINITSASETLGEIAVRGRLLDRQGKTLADFQQTYRLWRGSRVLLLDIEIEPHEEPHADPWNSYIASRFAWADESAEMWRSLHQMRHAVTQNRFEAPHYIEIVHGQCRMSILTGGLPFHRRVGLRMLDSLLVVRGERQRRFRFGIGIGLSHPLHEAMSLMAPPPMLHQVAASPAPSASSWLFHIDGKNVVATHWEPLSEENRVHGFRARLLETAGRPARLTLSSFRPVASARQMNFLNEPLSDCQIDQGKIRLELSAHEWVEVQAAFEK